MRIIRTVIDGVMRDVEITQEQEDLLRRTVEAEVREEILANNVIMSSQEFNERIASAVQIGANNRVEELVKMSAEYVTNEELFDGEYVDLTDEEKQDVFDTINVKYTCDKLCELASGEELNAKVRDTIKDVLEKRIKYYQFDVTATVTFPVWVKAKSEDLARDYLEDLGDYELLDMACDGMANQGADYNFGWGCEDVSTDEPDNFFDSL